MKKTLVIMSALALFSLPALPALAIIDDGSGCGCIRPCHILKR